MAEYLGAELAPIPRLVLLELVHFIGTITPGPACSCMQHCSTAGNQARYILQSSGRAFTTEKLALVNPRNEVLILISMNDDLETSLQQYC